jgi:exonuclease SbcC
MKILAIRLKNLASLAGPFELDFTAQPLASAGLFAITGPTGAGKSTLLDALCLALFGAVPRLSHTARDAKVPDAEGEIATGDPRTLLRRGTGGGYAEVDFLGVDGRRYRARWEANRARDKAGGKLQPSRQSLVDLDSGQLIAAQKREYEVELEQRLGLNFEQFTRAVLLAQSEFSAFLKANDNERSELLEKLTDTALYTQLGKRAFDKTRQTQAALKSLQDQSIGILPMPGDERAALDLRYAEALQAYQADQLRQRELEQQWQWQQHNLQLLARREAAEQHSAQALTAWDGLAPMRETFTRLQQLAPQRHLFERQQQTHAQLQPLAGQIATQYERLTALKSEESASRQRHHAATEALALALADQAQAAPRLREAFDAMSLLARRDEQLAESATVLAAATADSERGQNQLHDWQAQQQSASERLQGITRRLAASAELALLGDSWDLHRRALQNSVALSARLQQGQAEMPALRQRADEGHARLARLQEDWQALYDAARSTPDQLGEQLQASAAQLQAWRQSLRDTEQLHRHWLRLDDLTRQRAELAEEQQTLFDQCERRTAEGLHCKQQHEQAEQTLAVTLQVLDRQRLARSESVEQLRAQLQDDQPCPVCGSLAHPFRHSATLLQALSQHDDQEEQQARQALQALATRLTELRVEVSGLRQQHKRNQQREQDLAELHASLSQTLHEHPCYGQLPDSEQAFWLGNREQQLSRDIAELEQQQQQWLTLQQQAAHLHQQIDGAREDARIAQQQLDQQQQQLHADQQRLDEDLQGLAGRLPAARLDSLRQTPAAAFLELDRQMADRQALLDQQTEEQASLSERQQRIDQQSLLQQGLDSQRLKASERQASQACQRETEAQHLADLLGAHAHPGDWQRLLEAQVHAARQEERASAQAEHDLHTQRVLLGGALQASEQQLEDLTQALAALDDAIGLWRAQHPGLDNEGLAALLAHDAGQQDTLRESLRLADLALEQARAVALEREQRYQAHQVQASPALTEAPLEEALRLSQAACAAGEEHCADLRAQQNEDQRRVQANARLQEQIAAAQDECRRWGRINDVVGSSTGDRFRKIAQAYNLDLLVHHANAQLRQLARRYRLQRGGSMLGLLVMDTEMGDELRSVHSLSGGETFLVSLALALGLASMASNTLKIESLFIDEGFGSLDPDSLQLAMDALDSLQAQGRKVAVISHVQEMHERIPVQIQVRRLGNGLSAIEVQG